MTDYNSLTTFKRYHHMVRNIIIEEAYINWHFEQAKQANYLVIHRFCIGAQSFEYFGASLAALDMIGDGVDELIVGSPLFSNSRSMQQSTSSSVHLQLFKRTVYSVIIYVPSFV